MKYQEFIYILPFALIVLFSGINTSAQERPVPRRLSGVVLDKNKEPIAEVSIGFKEDDKNGVTDSEGHFSIQYSDGEYIFFQKKGYQTIKVPATGSNLGEIRMVESIIDAGETDNVNIPFGIRKKRHITGSISSIKGDELPQTPISVVNNLLSGRIPGLYVQQTGTSPGAEDVKFLIRGQSTYSSIGQYPTVLVDGVIRDFADMDVNEIENITVLKDATSLAWYGVRGGNGVINVTTRRGSDSKPKVTFDFSGGVQAPENYTRPLDSYTFGTLYNEALANTGAAPKYDQTALDAYKNGTDPYKYPQNKLVDRFINDYSPVQRYTATISGGTQKARYFTLASFYNQSGLLNETEQSEFNTNINFQRYNIRSNVDVDLNEDLNVSMEVGGRSENRRQPEDGLAAVMSSINTTPSNAYPLLNADGSYGGTSIFQSNPLGMLQGRGFKNTNTRVLLFSVNSRYKLDKLVKGLSADVHYSYDITQSYISGRSQNYAVFQLNSNGTTYSRFRTPAALSYLSASYDQYEKRSEFWAGLDYDKTFGEQVLNVSTRFQLSTRTMPNVLDNKAQFISARASYSFKNRYFADLVASYSATDNFAKSKRFAFCPAVSAGWVISEEEFLKSNGVINYFKLRGSMGLSGNEGQIERRFAYKDLWTGSGVNFPFGAGYSYGPSATQLALANPDLSPEKVLKSDIGFDAKFLDQSLSLCADYFYEKRTGILTNDILPSTIGQSLLMVNEGSAKYQGMEGSLNYSKRIGKLNVDFFGNVTLVKSEIINVNESNIPDYQRSNGYSISGKRVLQAMGIFQTPQEIADSPVQQFSLTVAPGDIRYKDVNNDGFVNNLDAVMTDQTDIPKIYYGFGFNLKYSGFDLAVFFQGIGGRTIDLNSLINAGDNNNGYLNQFSVDRWTSTTAGTAKYPRLLTSDRGNNTQSSTFWLRSGDYLRLKSTEIGYSLPNTVLEKIKLSGCRFYISGFNLLTFKKLKEATDPEIPGAGFLSSYPYVKTVSLGVNVKF